jgi:hypothetical protein
MIVFVSHSQKNIALVAERDQVVQYYYQFLYRFSQVFFDSFLPIRWTWGQGKITAPLSANINVLSALRSFPPLPCLLALC